MSDPAFGIQAGVSDCSKACPPPKLACTGSGPPDCGCTPDSIGAHWIYFADGDHDCQVTVSELGSCDLFQTLLAPDVTIDGQGMLSVGVEVTAVAATFTRP